MLIPPTRGAYLVRGESIYDPSFWLADPDVPALTGYQLDPDGEYVEVGRATGSARFAVTRPFPVTIVPTAMVAGLHPD